MAKYCTYCEQVSNGPMISPCHCTSPFTKYWHRECLDKWTKKWKPTSCDFCQYRYVMTTKMKPSSQRQRMKAKQLRYLLLALLWLTMETIMFLAILNTLMVVLNIPMMDYCLRHLMANNTLNVSKLSNFTAGVLTPCLVFIGSIYSPVWTITAPVDYLVAWFQKNLIFKIENAPQDTGIVCQDDVAPQLKELALDMGEILTKSHREHTDANSDCRPETQEVSGPRKKKCYICQRAKKPSHLLVKACKCTGPYQYAHIKCLLREIRERSTVLVKCTYCNHRYLQLEKVLWPGDITWTTKGLLANVFAFVIWLILHITLIIQNILWVMVGHPDYSHREILAFCMTLWIGLLSLSVALIPLYYTDQSKNLLVIIKLPDGSTFAVTGNKNRYRMIKDKQTLDQIKKTTIRKNFFFRQFTSFFERTGVRHAY